jgi:DNA processing protein
MVNLEYSFDLPPLLPTTEEDTVDRLRLLRSRRVGIADYAVCPIASVHAELDAGRKAGERLILEGNADYPSALCDISDAPPPLFGRLDRWIY